MFDVRGSRYPVVVHDERQSRRAPFSVRTINDDEVQRLRRLVRNNDVVLIHAPAGHGIEPGYWSIGDVIEARVNRRAASNYREWILDDAVEVESP